MTIYRGLSGVNREIRQQFRGLGGANREIKEQYRGLGGVNRQVFKKGNPLSTKGIGSVVKLKVSGMDRDFLIIQQGKPSAIYDDSCNGTWLMMKDIYESRQWHSSNSNDYANSTIHSYLNGTFLNLFAANIQSVIKQVKIPYRPGNKVNDESIYSGAYGLSAKIFLLSAYEINWNKNLPNGYYLPADGSTVSYFSGISAVDAKRIAYLNGSAALWWLRSPYTYNSTHAWVVQTDGGYGGGYSYRSCSYPSEVRPTLVLPFDVSVDDNGVILI